MKWNHLKSRWVLQSSAKSILEDDIICLLQGALNPSILRQSEDYFTIIAVAITLANATIDFLWTVKHHSMQRRSLGLI
ncbi:hypothetical protein J3F84DRAFT_373910 [Trichoderma pleuroticola]